MATVALGAMVEATAEGVATAAAEGSVPIDWLSTSKWNSCSGSGHRSNADRMHQVLLPSSPKAYSVHDSTGGVNIE